ncbi:hypothetical protein ABFZ85_09160 [Hyphococcus formosus]|uniref:hypothetical protein n=1 Tax=Hyphococcus formosus TaxID=3143534 RepID=UPI00398AE409
MRKISGLTIGAISAAGLLSAAQAQDASPQYYPPYVPPSQSSIYNQSSVFLPTPPVAHGQDSVRGASGLSCQSAVASGGPYLDIGMIGAQDVFDRETATVYGRIVVPLGKRPDRPDCTKLYDLEIARLRMELELLRMGLPPGMMAQQPSPDTQGEAVMVDPIGAQPVTLISREP